MNFIFSCSTRYLTSERSERVRYRVEYLEIQFITTCGHVISSLYLIIFRIALQFSMLICNNTSMQFSMNRNSHCISFKEFDVDIVRDNTTIVDMAAVTFVMKEAYHKNTRRPVLEHGVKDMKIN